MKVFIRASDLVGNDPPVVVASYDDNADVPPNAHGEGMTVLTVPASAIIYDRQAEDGASSSPPKLIGDWRERLARTIAEGEARQRIEQVLSPQEQIDTLRETVELLIKHGPDVAEWPTDAKNRKAEIDDALNYVRDVRARLRGLKSVQGNPTSDKLWPTRIAKR